MRLILPKGAKNIFGPALRRARLASPIRMTQTDLAESVSAAGLPLDRSAISRIENQERFLSDVELVHLANALHIDIQKLFRLLQHHPNALPAFEEFRLEDDDWQVRVAEAEPRPARDWP